MNKINNWTTLIENYSNPGDWIFDFFCGTASMSISAGIMGRNYVGVDMDPRQLTAAGKRITRRFSNAIFDSKIEFHVS